MRAGPISTATGDVVFTLERFELLADGRLEVVGRWSGVRGRRFLRPSLSIGRDRPLLADLVARGIRVAIRQVELGAFLVQARAVHKE